MNDRKKRKRIRLNLIEQRFNVFHEFFNGYTIRSLAVSPDVLLGVHQYKAAAVVESSRQGRVFDNHIKIIVGYFVEAVLISSDEEPLAGINSQVVGVLMQAPNGIPFGVDGMGKEQQVGAIPEPFVNFEHIFRHDGANGGTGSEEKIGDISFAGKSGVGYQVAILANKGEVRDLGVYHLPVYFHAFT